MTQAIQAVVPAVVKKVPAGTAAVDHYIASLADATAADAQTQTIPAASATFPLTLSFTVTDTGAYVVTVASYDANGNLLDPGVPSLPINVTVAPATISLNVAGQPVLTEVDS